MTSLLLVNALAAEYRRKPSAPSGQYPLAIEEPTPATRKPRSAQECRGRIRTPIWSLSSPADVPRSNQQHKGGLQCGILAGFSDVYADAPLVATPDRPAQDR